ncbi:hypothetical protein HPB49_001685 [Dermacentor silvarum]|uniref:Uncharacterized protein n=1 Tax=Dermacentor silvarum TaxID=543639 RepID=A0ACB8CJ95_DERSI|nr:hypothetical protein HPB49_001685 [Dermacentor silvarum]
MSGDARLKKKTRQSYGKKRKRPWNAWLNIADDSALTQRLSVALEAEHSTEERPEPPDASESQSTDAVDSAGPSCITSGAIGSTAGTSSGIQGRVDMKFYSVGESAERARSAAILKESLASQCATERKFKLLDVELVSDDKENGTEFVIVDLAVINTLFGIALCPECGTKTMTLSKADSRDFGLCSKLVLSCRTCDLCEERFSSPRVAGDTGAKITPFEVNLRAMKAMNSIGKGATALSDFFAAMNVSHRGLHHKIFPGPHEGYGRSVQCDCY